MSLSDSKSHLNALLVLLIAMISVQSSGSLAKMLFAQYPALTVSAMRLCFGALILSVIFKAWTINWRQIRWRAIISYGIALAGMNALFYLSLQRLPLGIAVAFEFIGPLSVALFYARQRYDLLWVGCAILGLILLFPFGQAQHGLDSLGIVLALAAGACWALYIIAGQKPSGVSGNHTVFLGMTVGALILLPFALLSGNIGQVFEFPNLFLFIILAILASALPFSLEMLALKRLTPLSFGTLMSLEPAVAAFSGFIFLGEILLWNQWLALATIITASVGCTLTTQRARKMQD
ncbi:EamA family transporter [uncultured Acinetobacter sp.]|uniref:EamA family transporter n=1 Tax=uncultured Acinetobacter sp. TaxID=165433 RepID=UPI002584D198|nr:EamA family transporter [uncultured Acinetobacter sp.]